MSKEREYMRELRNSTKRGLAPIVIGVDSGRVSPASPVSLADTRFFPLKAMSVTKNLLEKKLRLDFL